MLSSHIFNLTACCICMSFSPYFEIYRSKEKADGKKVVKMAIFSVLPSRHLPLYLK